MGFNFGNVGGYVGVLALLVILVLALTGHCSFNIGTAMT